MKRVPEEGRDATRAGSHPRPRPARNGYHARCSSGLSHRTTKSVSDERGSRPPNATLGASAVGIPVNRGVLARALRSSSLDRSQLGQPSRKPSAQREVVEVGGRGGIPGGRLRRATGPGARSSSAVRSAVLSVTCIYARFHPQRYGFQQGEGLKRRNRGVVR